jgi:Predicted permease.
MALGAHRRDIFSLIMRQGAIQTALAVTIGLLFSLAAGRVLARILYQVSPSDPFALVISGALLAAAAMLALFFPSATRHTRRAAQSVAHRMRAAPIALLPKWACSPMRALNG